MILLQIYLFYMCSYYLAMGSIVLIVKIFNIGG